jgi:hypothetical protein
MENGHWEIGVNAETLDDLLGGEDAHAMLWFLAGYLKGFSDSASLNGSQMWEPQVSESASTHG